MTTPQISENTDNLPAVQDQWSEQNLPQKDQTNDLTSNDYVKHSVGWVATLSDGSTMYDDGKEPNSWFRLRDFLKENDLCIVGLSLRKGNHYIQLADNCRGYSVVRGVAMIITGGQQFPTITACHTISRGNQELWIKQSWEARTLQQLEHAEKPLESYEKTAIFNG